jgi:hypothetical protein
VKELRSGSRCRMRASVAVTTLDALIWPAATAAPISAAVLQAKSTAGVSSMEYRRRFGIVGERKFIDQRRKSQNQLKIEFDPVVPGWINRQSESLRARHDQGIYDIGRCLHCARRIALGADGFLDAGAAPGRFCFPRPCLSELGGHSALHVACSAATKTHCGLTRFGAARTTVPEAANDLFGPMGLRCSPFRRSRHAGVAQNPRP